MMTKRVRSSSSSVRCDSAVTTKRLKALTMACFEDVFCEEGLILPFLSIAFLLMKAFRSFFHLSDNGHGVY